ncbi:MAG TPA: O-antigen ligase family protein [Marmoricola sp.]|jgi:O-antigen ligase|nr:O-antigen ligase family protein [Marmoricola sp.]
MSATIVGMVVLLLLLVIGVSTNSLLYSIAAVFLGIALTVLVGIGPEKMGIGLMLLGMFAAPMNALGLAGNVDISDVFFVFGFGLLIPRILSTGRPKLPPLYVIGASILFVGGMVTSLISPSPSASLVGFVKIIAATMILVFVLNLLRPAGKLLDSLAWAYVFGQGVSVAYGLVRHGATHAQGRGVGLTTQPNFYGLGGQMAYALLIFLFYRVDPKNRWFVLGGMVVVGYSVVDSGSRASLLCCALITIVWPIVERSAVAWYVIITGGILAVLGGNAFLVAIGQDNVISRLKGNTSAQFSDQARTSLLHQGWDLFLKNPIRGNGWSKDTILAFHNAYLEVAVGGGVLTLVGFVLVIAALVRPLFQAGKPNRLAYAGLSYAAFGMIGPTLYDRIVWAVLCLILVAHEPSETPPDAGSHQEKTNLTRAKRLSELESGAARQTKVMTPRRPRLH